MSKWKLVGICGLALVTLTSWYYPIAKDWVWEMKR